MIASTLVAAALATQPAPVAAAPAPMAHDHAAMAAAASRRTTWPSRTQRARPRQDGLLQGRLRLLRRQGRGQGSVEG